MSNEAVAVAINDTLNDSRNYAVDVIPSWADVDRLTRVFIGNVMSNPKLVKSSTESLKRAYELSCESGLEVNGIDAHLIPYWNSRKKCFEAQFQSDYKGLVKLVEHSPDIKYIRAVEVCENDTPFEVQQGSNAKIIHSIDYKNTDKRGDIVAVYSIVTFSDGSEAFEIMPISEVNKHRDCSKAYKYYLKEKAEGRNPEPPIWVTWYLDMIKKTVLRKHCKMLPKGDLCKRILSEEDKDQYEYAEEVKDVEVKTVDKAEKMVDEFSNKEPKQEIKEDSEGNASPGNLFAPTKEEVEYFNERVAYYRNAYKNAKTTEEIDLLMEELIKKDGSIPSKDYVSISTALSRKKDKIVKAQRSSHDGEMARKTGRG